MTASTPLTFEILRDKNVARSKEWDPEGKLDISFFGLELAGEVGEACNIIKKIVREELGLRGSRASMDDLAEELADVAIVLSLTAECAGINLAEAIIRKFDKTSDKLGLSIKFRS